MNSAEPSSPELWACHLGVVPYRDAVQLQQQIRERRLAEELPDVLLMLEHPPVYTRGRRAAPGELALGEDFYRARGIEIFDTDRGGRVTYHGPGQLVGYPIMRIHDIGAHLRTMESAIVSALAEYGVQARSRCHEGPDYTGVWVADRKIASIGVHVSRGVTTHGFAINLTNDLDPFSWVVACGLADVAMTSLARELAPGATIEPEDFRTRICARFCAIHGRRRQLVSPHALGVDTDLFRRFGPDAGENRLESVRGRTPRAEDPGISATCADATLLSNPTPDTGDLLTGHGAAV